MKKSTIWAAGLAITALVATLWQAWPLGPDACETRGGLRLCRFPFPHDVVTATLPAGSPPELFFQGDTTATTRQFSESGGFALAVNGPYFGGFPPEARPAGLLVLEGKTLNGIAMDDPNLTDVVTIFDGKNPDISVVPNAAWRGTSSGAVAEFQAGPMLLSGGVAQTASMARSTHATLPFPRTVLIRKWDPASGTYETVFLVAKKPVTLPELADWIRRKITDDGRSWTIDLDGGPSVSLHARDFPGDGFREERVLPARFGVR